MENKQDKFIFSVTVGEKGQIVIPKQLRDLFGIKPGDPLLLLADLKRGIAIPPKDAFSDLQKNVFGAPDGGKDND